MGQQVTLTSANAAAVGPRIDLLKQRAAAPFVSRSLSGVVKECDLVAQVVQNGHMAGYLYDPVAGDFVGRSETRISISDTALRALAATPGQEVTYTATTPGSGARIAFRSVIVPRRVRLR